MAIEVVEGNTGDPKTIPAQVARLKERFGLERVVVVGDRGMVTEARIREDIATVGYDWISALVHKSIQPLVQAKVITPSLFDERGLGEISHPDYPGERLIACFNPIRAEDQVRKREELLALTEKGLQKVADACRREKKPLQGHRRDRPEDRGRPGEVQDGQVFQHPDARLRHELAPEARTPGQGCRHGRHLRDPDLPAARRPWRPSRPC